MKITYDEMEKQIQNQKLTLNQIKCYDQNKKAMISSINLKFINTPPNNTCDFDLLNSGKSIGILSKYTYDTSVIPNSKINKQNLRDFCEFQINPPNDSGIYVVIRKKHGDEYGDILYIGETRDMSKRWGKTGYASITPSNAKLGGQVTNCVINNAIRSAINDNYEIYLYFHKRPSVESLLINAYKPGLNNR